MFLFLNKPHQAKLGDAIESKTAITWFMEREKLCFRLELIL